MPSLWKVAKTTRAIASASSTVKDPAAAAKRRARSKAAGELGLWKLVAKVRGR